MLDTTLEMEASEVCDFCWACSWFGLWIANPVRESWSRSAKPHTSSRNFARWPPLWKTGTPL